MHPCKLPAPLTLGDRLWVIMPSGALRDREAFDKGVGIWRSRGYVIDLCEDYDACWGYLAGTDAQRRLALKQGLTDPTIKGIICGRGGYGGARLLEDWNWPNLTPKWLIGFSDITSLLWGYAQQNVSGVHGPVLTTLASEPDWSRQRLWNWIEGKNIEDLKGNGWGNGIAEGYLLPCNLTVATHLLGTALAPDFSNVILALEDVGEAPYRIDRMLTQWRMTGAIQQVQGIALGRFSQSESDPNIPSFTIEEVLHDRLKDLNIPIVSDLPFGHDGVNAVLPVGVKVTIDGDRGALSISST